MLRVDNAHVMIGAVEALRGFSLDLKEGEMVGLTGRNGAGKTTLMRAVMGLVKLRRGQVMFGGEDFRKVPVHHRAGLGIGYMPEDRGLVPELTVEENLLLPTWVTPALDGPERLSVVYEILPELREMAGRRALLLSGGQQKMVALGRALAVGTRLLLLDEPFEGVAPALSQRLSDVIFGLRQQNLSVVVSQSELNHSHALFDREFVIERGANLVAVAGEAPA
ncbi:ABC transporter ATP-binding protein [Algihabitans albus]|uniref:ABC transporter ATP-binding protein n=1 Tax=Algihabitans albus TaxID=2164067 RepID=UPI000E5DA4DA|nr:ATP-binding cassette domain-containing protein [Algihabitans albus]